MKLTDNKTTVILPDVSDEVTRERQHDYQDRHAARKFNPWQRFILRRARGTVSRLAGILLCYAYERGYIDSRQMHILNDSFHRALYPEDRREQEFWS